MTLLLLFALCSLAAAGPRPHAPIKADGPRPDVPMDGPRPDAPVKAYGPRPDAPVKAYGPRPDDEWQSIEIKHGHVKSFSTRCMNIPPGMDKLKLGMDIAKLDLMPKEQETADQGYKRSVFDYTCEEGKTVTIKGVEYELPDQIWDVSTFPRGVMIEDVNIIKSKNDVKKSLALNLGISLEGAATEKGLFEGSGSFEQMSQVVTEKNSNIEEVSCFVSATRADLIPYWGQLPSRFITMFIKRMPKTFEENPRKYHEFIKWFGTHYFMSAKFGGIVRMRMETSKNYYTKNSDWKIKAQADGLMRDILKSNGGIDVGNTKVDENFKDSTKNTIRYYGGDTNLLNEHKNWADWTNTIMTDPWVYGGELSSNEDFFEAEPSMQEGFRKAVRAHLDKVHAAAQAKLGKRHLMLRREFGQVETANEINDLVLQLDEASRDLAPSHDDVAELSKKMETALRK